MRKFWEELRSVMVVSVPTFRVVALGCVPMQSTNLALDSSYLPLRVLFEGPPNELQPWLAGFHFTNNYSTTVGKEPGNPGLVDQHGWKFWIRASRVAGPSLRMFDGARMVLQQLVQATAIRRP